MSISFEIVQGDLDPDMEIDLTELVDSPAELQLPIPNDATVTMRWAKPNGTFATVALVVIDASTGILARLWTAGDTDVPGVHNAQVVITRSNGQPQSIPSDGGDMLRWIVWPRLGG